MAASKHKLTFLWLAVCTLQLAHAIRMTPLNAPAALRGFFQDYPISTVPAPPLSNTHAADVKKAFLAGNQTSSLPGVNERLCPESCKLLGSDPSKWFVYHDTAFAAKCNQPMLLDFALVNPIDDPKTPVKIAACTADDREATKRSATISSSNCQREHITQSVKSSALRLQTSGSSAAGTASDVLQVLQSLQMTFDLRGMSCNATIDIASSGLTVAGAYIGAGLSAQHLGPELLTKIAAEIQHKASLTETMFVQLCNETTARYMLGLYISTRTDLGAVQAALGSWQNSTCISSSGQSSLDFADMRYMVASSSPDSGITGNSTTTPSNGTLPLTPSHFLSPRANCRTIQVVSGDTCSSLASECGITPAQFTQYNPGSSTCSSLRAGQHVCCSAGTLPDYSPKPYANGTCYTYVVVSGDSCSSIAAAHSLTPQTIEIFNAKTWGWTGCSKLFAGYNICLSKGNIPMPLPVPNTVCGPQVPGTPAAPPGTNLSTLNGCLLNACCDIWGQCGTTAEFCTISQSDNQAPGTAAPGQNGCISNCGTDIVTSPAPASVFNIAYFEAYDWARKCLRMPVTQLDTTYFTHIHFSFATFNPDLSVNTDAIAAQLPLFASMTGVKKIISFGGWGFSTDLGTYQIFRDVVKSPANRATAIASVVNFVHQYGLDGVDIDWEYPNEPDIPGIQPGTKIDSIGLLLFVDGLRDALPSGKTISVTAPASFWYLKGFPIQALSIVADYIVYMTYDLHGQWDYGNKWSDEGCPSGSCLRSHVNLTETINALSMLTKAGVPSNMIVVGVSSYGRSFQMANAGCWTEQCTFTGPDSGAEKGLCTNTAGYIAQWEIDSILSSNPSVHQYWDPKAFSDIIVYDQTQWVSYMSASNKAGRMKLYPALNFLGTADWAVDLQSLDGDGSPDLASSDIIYIDPGIWASSNPMVTASTGATLIWPPMPLGSTTTISFPLLTTSVTYSSLTTLTTSLPDGSVSSYPWYNHISWLTVLTIPPGMLFHSDFLNISARRLTIL
ncbi:glycoside hydrolase family 18 protein [Dissoconium aciculare CBS 342.82]|uniref:chitinase n=1 Tax=Dissoconium aciculare CBS 342.82 TaxID=1314786 RepID=A0A6J3LU31_9PEZI|nr:glycoside hydrolase family 18 protein [Dissoconium aciculare CBS 342.82]KAF1819301.1 glycoside hydrolase family 18 protein [Dissoconium aciculare CBS 342.82]